MADARHLEKSKNRHISATVEPIGTKFRSLALLTQIIVTISKF